MAKKIISTNPSIALYLDVAEQIAAEYEFDGAEFGILAFEMSNAIMNGKLKVVDPATSFKVDHRKILINRSGFVFVNDLNDWLKNNNFPYKWNPSLQKNKSANLSIQKPLTKYAVAIAFEGLKYSYDQWIKYCQTVPKWLSPAIKVRGNKGTPTTWDPVEIGLLLLDKGTQIKKLDAVFNVELKNWLKLWEEKTALLRD